jgi:hypothetical protein
MQRLRGRPDRDPVRGQLRPPVLLRVPRRLAPRRAVRALPLPTLRRARHRNGARATRTARRRTRQTHSIIVIVVIVVVVVVGALSASSTSVSWKQPCSFSYRNVVYSGPIHGGAQRPCHCLFGALRVARRRRPRRATNERRAHSHDIVPKEQPPRQLDVAGVGVNAREIVRGGRTQTQRGRAVGGAQWR